MLSTLNAAVFMYMMDSMTDDELDGKVEITPSRIGRIARGSGQQPEHVQVLLISWMERGGGRWAPTYARRA